MALDQLEAFLKKMQSEPALTAIFSLMRHSSSSEQTSFVDGWDSLNSWLF